MTDGNTTKSTTIKSLEKKFSEQNEQNEERLVAIEGTLGEAIETAEKNHDSVLKAIAAIHLPASIPKIGRTSEEMDFHGFEDSDIAEIRPGLHSVAGPEFKDKAEQTRFDMEMIEVQVMPSASTYPDVTFTVGVNGRQILIVRGPKQRIPRCYAEVMARAKISTYGNVETIDPNTNEMVVKNPESYGARYPFIVTEDKSPFAEAWFERVTNDKR